MTWTSFRAGVATFFATSGVNILRAAIILVIGYYLIKFGLKVLNRVLAKAKIEKSARKFLYVLLKYLLYVLLIMSALSTLGISITGLVAVLSAAGLAISLALQSSLSNLANGVVIVITKPFKEGDVISVQGYDGIIKEIKLTYTVVKGFDNKIINIPNKSMVDTIIVNTSESEKRRIFYHFLVSYDSDVEKVKDIILTSFARTNYVLTDPQPVAALEDLKDNGISFKAICYVENKNYGAAYTALLEDIFNEFKKQHISMPYAQLDVKIKDKEEKLPFYNETKLTNAPEPEVEPEPIKEETKPETDSEEDGQEKEYLEYLVDESVEVEEKDEDTEEVEEPEKKKKFFKKQKQATKKPTIIIKKK